MVFVYAARRRDACDAAVPNESALGARGLINRAGNVLAIMPHPERDGWNFNHSDRARAPTCSRPRGGAALFRSFVEAVRIA